MGGNEPGCVSFSRGESSFGNGKIGDQFSLFISVFPLNRMRADANKKRRPLRLFYLLMIILSLPGRLYEVTVFETLDLHHSLLEAPPLSLALPPPFHKYVFVRSFLYLASLFFPGRY